MFRTLCRFFCLFLGHQIFEEKRFIAVRQRELREERDRYIVPMTTRWDRCKRCSYKLRVYPPAAELF